MYCRLNQAIINGCRNACSQFKGITFTVSFCEHSHTFVKIEEFVMGHPGQMVLRRAHPCTIDTTWTYNMGLLDHCFCLFVFVALRPKSTAMVIAGRSVHLTTLFPGQA